MYKNKDKKKIVIFMPSFEGGGVEKNVVIITNYFAKKKLDVSLITASKNVKKKFNRKINFISPSNNSWDYYGRIPKYLVSLFLLFKKFKNDKNLKIFCFQGNILCIIFCKIFNLKIIIRPNSSPSGWSNNIFKRILFTKILSWADKIIVNSIEFKKQLKKNLNLNSICIYNPLNTFEIKKLSKKKISFVFFKKNYTNLISIGRLVYQKDHISLLKSINSIKNKIKMKLLIIGEGDQKKNLMDYINKNSLNKIVKIKNRIENPYPYILKSDIMLLTSRFEGLPNVLLEGLTLNKFIISSDCPTGPNEILDNGKGGLLYKVGDYLDLGNKILQCKKQKKKINNLKKFALRRLNRFDYKKNLDNYYNIVKNL